MLHVFIVIDSICVENVIATKLPGCSHRNRIKLGYIVICLVLCVLNKSNVRLCDINFVFGHNRQHYSTLILTVSWLTFTVPFTFIHSADFFIQTNLHLRKCTILKWYQANPSANVGSVLPRILWQLSVEEEFSWAARLLCAETACLSDTQFPFGAVCTHSSFKSPLPLKMNFVVADNFVWVAFCDLLCRLLSLELLSVCTIEIG